MTVQQKYDILFINQISWLDAFIWPLKRNAYSLEMWANAHRDGRSAEYRWRPLFNATVWLCSNTAKTRDPLKFAGVPQTTGCISAVSKPKFTILWGNVEDISLLNKFFPLIDKCVSCEDIARQT